MSGRKTDLMWCIDCDKFPCKEIMDENGVMRASGCFCYDSMEKGEHTDELKKARKERKDKMTRIEILKQELEQIKGMRCLAYDIKEQAIKWYENEIKVIEEYGE